MTASDRRTRFRHRATLLLALLAFPFAILAVAGIVTQNLVLGAAAVLVAVLWVCGRLIVVSFVPEFVGIRPNVARRIRRVNLMVGVGFVVAGLVGIGCGVAQLILRTELGDAWILGGLLLAAAGVTRIVLAARRLGRPLPQRFPVATPDAVKRPA